MIYFVVSHTGSPLYGLFLTCRSLADLKTFITKINEQHKCYFQYTMSVDSVFDPETISKNEVYKFI